MRIRISRIVFDIIALLLIFAGIWWNSVVVLILSVM